MEPCGKCTVAIDSAFTLVTTAEFLADPTPKDLQEIYEAWVGGLVGLLQPYVGGDKIIIFYEFRWFSHPGFSSYDIVILILDHRDQGSLLLQGSSGI